jgi:hypothetical protein
MSDAVDDVKKTPLRPKQKWTMGLLGIIILASGFVLGASTTFFVLQDKVVTRPGPKPRPDRGKEFAEKYHLSPEQQEKVDALFESQHKLFKDMYEDSAAIMKTNREEMVAEMKTILTPEQFQRWEKEFLDRFKRRGRGDGGRRWGGPGRGPGSGPGGGPDGGSRRGPGSRGHDLSRPRGPQEQGDPDRTSEAKEE